MDYFKLSKNAIRTLYYRIRESLSPSAITNVNEIPIIINNFNRLTMLKRLIAALEVRGHTNIYIIDNLSTYPPLLAYYDSECPYTVLRLNENMGFKALWKSGLSKRFCTDYYIYTDSDVVPVNECPDDFIEFFFKMLKKYPFARKIGFSLRIDDLPDYYAQKEKVIAWESRFFKKQNKDGLYRAPIDTTFALYRPRVGLSRSTYVEAYRTPFPYQLLHLPWYQDSSSLTQEDQYYVDHCAQTTAWSSLQEKK